MTVEIRAAALAERPAVQQLVDLAFDAESYGPSVKHPSLSVGQSHLDPYDRPENTRVLLVNGEIVSVVHILARRAYAFRRPVGFGLISIVATHPEHRRRGYLRLLMADAEQHMRERGLCYGVLMGRFGYYAGSLGWHWCDEKRHALRSIRLAPATECPSLALEEATAENVPFLADLYQSRYATRFGPVVRSSEYWRSWSLRRPKEGVYVTARDGARCLGYFHFGSGVDEIGWVRELPRASERVFLGASAWAARRGESQVAFWFDEIDEPAHKALRAAFGDLPRTFVDPQGQPVRDGAPTRFVPKHCPDESGLMVKWLFSDSGTLKHVDSTDSLTQRMAQHSWTILDGDMA